MKLFTDKVGTAIKPGCWIVYGHALGRCAGLRLGRVKAVGPAPEDEFGGRSGDCRISVQGIDDDWCSIKPALCARVGTLQYSDRVLVLADNQVPGWARTLIPDAPV